MAEIGLGWRTDLAVLRYSGSEIQERDDHLVIRTAANPTYHWGNFVLVTDTGAVDDAERWRARFAEEFPQAQHLSIGLPGEPDRTAWAGAEIESSDVLVATGDISDRRLAEGYTVRRIETEQDWDASTALDDEHYPGEEEFNRRRSLTRARLVSAGHLTWFGAFTSDGDQLVSELGIVPVEAGLARYQAVLTHADHRRRGLTSHLLGVAARHARAGGAARLVIIADADSDAGRLYRAAGFTHSETVWQAYLRPAPESAQEVG